MRFSGRIDFEARSLEPLHHGDGSVGNTQILRTQRVYSPDIGQIVRLPYVSGNSLKHHIRVGAVRYALDAIGVGDYSLTKPVVHLLFSGGSLGKKGSTVRLDKARQLEQLLPFLSLCGYSAANVILPSKLRVDHMHLVCLENKWRMPDRFRETPEASKRMVEYRSEEFGTRHEPTRIDHWARRLLTREETEMDELSMAATTGVIDNGQARGKQPRTAQMLYEFESIAPGSLWYGGFYYDELTELELVAMKSAFALLDSGKVMIMGAKSSVGFGRVAIKFQPCITITKEEDDNYRGLLNSNRDSILSLIEAVA